MTPIKFEPPDFAGLAENLDCRLEFKPKQTLDDVLPDQRIYKGPTKTRFTDIGSDVYDREKTAAALERLGGIPGEGECWHLVTDGGFDVIHMIDACIHFAGKPCRHLHIATLAANRKSVAGLKEMMDAGRLQTVSVLMSIFFRDGDSEGSRATAQAFADIGVQVHFAKTHAKYYLIAFDGPALVIEGSLNLRQCRSVEQLTVTNNRNLLTFYRNIFESLIPKP
jgi:hypothetical protein